MRGKKQGSGRHSALQVFARQYLLIDEFKTLGCLIRQYHVPLIVASLATVVMVLMQGNSELRLRLASRELEFLCYYGLIPLTVLALLKRRGLNALGAGLGDFRFWIPASLLYLLVALPVLHIGASFSSINEYYQTRHFDLLSYLYTTSIMMLGWEYLLRGFLIAGLRDSMKEGAILLQMIPFTLLHLGKPDVETLACIVSGLIWGYIAYRGRSFWPAFIMHLSINIYLKLLVVGWL